MYYSSGEMQSAYSTALPTYKAVSRYWCVKILKNRVGKEALGQNSYLELQKEKEKKKRNR